MNYKNKLRRDLKSVWWQNGMATIFIKKISVAYKQRKRKDLASIFFFGG